MKFALGKGIDKTDEEPRSHKKQLLVGGIAVAGFIVVIGLFVRVKYGNNANASAEFAGKIEVKRDACKLFTLDDAKKLLGKETSASNNNANAVSSRATVSTCSYSSGAKNIDELIALTVLVRSSNKIQARQAFEVARKPGAETIKNIGDQAYYSPETSQLNILKDESWIIIASSKGKSGKGTLGIPEQVAQVILNRL